MIPARRRISTMRVTVADVIVETSDTVTLVYDGPGPYEYRAGQYLTIDPHQFPSLLRFIQLMEILKKRKEPARAYSMASAPHEPLAITIKEETWVPGQQNYPTLLSPFLVHEVKPGMAMTIAGFTGPYHLPVDIENRTDHIVHLCAGSGSVPNWSMVKAALRTSPRLRHTFLYENETWEDIIYRDALNALAEVHAGRLRVVHMLTGRKHAIGGLSSTVRQGRIDADLIRRMAPDYATAMLCACGPALTPWDRLAARERGVRPPPRFIERVRGVVEELGIPSERFKEESYG